jgi:hypothetical protein
VADWVAISSLATAGGTLALAATTYASVRSANRAARSAERSLLAELRPLLIQSSPDDASQRIGFGDGVGVTAPGGAVGVEVIDARVYLVPSLRNVGPGIAVLEGGFVSPRRRNSIVAHAPLDQYRMLTRDIYIPPGKLGFWQIAFRDDDAGREEMLESLEQGEFALEVLYGDYEGGQRLITRFGVFRDEDDVWRHSVVRHWRLEDERPETSREASAS